MPRKWSNKQTELIHEWITRHPDLVPLFRDAIARDALADGRHDELLEDVVAFLQPFNAGKNILFDLALAAIHEADWDQLKAVILPPEDGEHA